jgi:hypothetical protein
MDVPLRWLYMCVAGDHTLFADIAQRSAETAFAGRGNM